MFQKIVEKVCAVVFELLRAPAKVGEMGWAQYLTAQVKKDPTGVAQLSEFVARVLCGISDELKLEFAKLVEDGQEAMAECRRLAGLNASLAADNDKTVAELEEAKAEIEKLRAEIEKIETQPARHEPRHDNDDKPDIWRETRVDAGVWVPPYLDGPAKKMVAAIYDEKGEDAARKAAEEELARLIAEGKTRPWGVREDQPREGEDEVAADGDEDELLPAKTKISQRDLRERAYEIFDEARDEAGVFTKPEVSSTEGRERTADYAIGKILPVLTADGEEAAKRATVLVECLRKHGYTEPRPTPRPAPKPAPTKAPEKATAKAPEKPKPASTPTPSPADDLNLRPYVVCNNGLGEKFLAKKAEAVTDRGETPVTIVFEDDVAVHLIQAGFDSLESVVATTATPGVEGWVGLVRTAQEHLGTVAAKEEKKEEEKGEESLTRKRERVKKAFPGVKLADDEVGALLHIRIRKPEHLIGKDLEGLAKQMAPVLPVGQGKAYARQLLEKLTAKPEPGDQPEQEPPVSPVPTSPAPTPPAPPAEEGAEEPPAKDDEPEEDVENLPVTVIPGITDSVAQKMARDGVHTVGDLAASREDDFAKAKLSKNQLAGWITAASEMIANAKTPASATA